MKGEFLSMKTTQKIAQLEKENSEYKKMIYELDKEVYRLFNIIKEASIYIKNNYSVTSEKTLELNRILNNTVVKFDEDKDVANIQ